MNGAAVKLARLAPLLLTLTACAAVAGAPASEISLHQSDSGHTYTVHVGDTVKLGLVDTFGVPGSSVVWNADSSDSAILSRVSTSRETPAGIAHSQARYVATFKAIKAGTALIKLAAVARCEAMNPAFCPQPSGQITVNVS